MRVRRDAWYAEGGEKSREYPLTTSLDHLATAAGAAPCTETHPSFNYLPCIIHDLHCRTFRMKPSELTGRLPGVLSLLLVMTLTFMEGRCHEF